MDIAAREAPPERGAAVTGDDARRYLLSRPEAWEDHPFGPDVYVYKVRKKMFATLGFEAGTARTDSPRSH